MVDELDPKEPVLEPETEPQANDNPPPPPHSGPTDPPDDGQ